MIKRNINLGSYSTAANGWTLTSWKLGEAQQKTNYIDRPGGDGAWDASTALTDGIPRYNNRPLTITLECSEGDRLTRKAKISQMVNQLDGMQERIELPDDEGHYLIGRLHVAENYNDLAHAAVTVTATCDPWKYSSSETVITLAASASKATAELINNGRRAVVPSLKVAGTGANVLLAYGSASSALSAGTYQWPDLLLTPGSHLLEYSGTGTLTLTYREAVLE